MVRFLFRLIYISRSRRRCSYYSNDILRLDRHGLTVRLTSDDGFLSWRFSCLTSFLSDSLLVRGVVFNFLYESSDGLSFISGVLILEGNYILRWFCRSSRLYLLSSLTRFFKVNRSRRSCLFECSTNTNIDRLGIFRSKISISMVISGVASVSSFIDHLIFFLKVHFCWPLGTECGLSFSDIVIGSSCSLGCLLRRVVLFISTIF